MCADWGTYVRRGVHIPLAEVILSMTETLIFSDIHGRAECLERLLAIFPESFAICLGDALGASRIPTSGANDRILSLLRERSIPCVKGNHEVDLIHLYEVNKTHLDWIETWPHRLVEADVLFCHTWIEENQGLRFHNIDSIYSAQEMFRLTSFRLAFVGHSHSPGWWELCDGSRPKWQHARAGETWSLNPGCRYIVDVGSLGEPQRPQGSNYVLWRDSELSWRGLSL